MIPLAAISMWRVGAGVALAIALASSHWWAYSNGRHQVQIEWDADTANRTAAALVAEQQARATEQALNDQVRKVSNAYTAEKARRATADRAAADSLRRLEAALAGAHREPPADPATPERADDDPRDGIIAECANALVRLDRAYRALAGQTTALQGYAASVCVTPQP